MERPSERVSRCTGATGGRLRDSPSVDSLTLSAPKRKPRTSFSQRVLLGIGLGVAAGLFFGELVAPLKELGDAYVGLLQMTVLPYIFVSLIGSIGQLSTSAGTLLIRRAGLTLLCLWAVGLAILPILASSYPTWEVGSFFSTSILEESEKVDYQLLYIPSNPFRSLASNFIPAVALFAILAGTVLMTMPRNERLLELLDQSSEMLTRVNRLVIRLTPIGVFGISASAAGTLTLEEFGLLQGYLISHALGVLALTFGVLPLIVISLTPLRYREVLRCAKEPLLTAFVTGSTFVTLPMIVENTRTLLEEKQLGGHAVNPSVVVPLGYSFPHLGKILSLVFVPFAAWFYGSPMSLADYPNFLVTGLLGSFGSLVVTIPMLLDQQHVPADIFHLFLLSGVVSARISDVLGSMHLLVFSLITTTGAAGLWRFKSRKALIGLVVVGVFTSASVAGVRVYLREGFISSYGKSDLLDTMRSKEPLAEVRVVPAEPNPVPLAEGQIRLARIRKTGVIRVGVNPAQRPFSFVNSEGELVGLDVDMAHRLALDLGVRLELVQIDAASMAMHLELDHCDLIMSGVESTLARSESFFHSDPYLYVTAAIVVRDYREPEFATMRDVLAAESLRVAVVVEGHASENAIRRAPNAEVVELDSAAQFFENDEGLDALAVSAEAGYSWTLRYPQFTVLNPLGRNVRVPLTYPIAGRDSELRIFINDWLELRRSSGLVDRLYDRWILGRGAEEKAPRWSIVRDVLGWVR